MMRSVIKIQLQHRYLKRIVIFIIFATMCFSLCSVYLNSGFVQNLFLNSPITFTNNLYLSYLSLTASAGILGYFSFNGFKEDKAILMGLVARKINIFYFIAGKMIASFIYSLLPSIVALVLSVYFFDISLVISFMLIINAYMLYYIIYFLTYLINGEKNFDIVLAYALVFVSFITSIIDTHILFSILLPIYIVMIILLYKYANQYIVMFMFPNNDFLLYKIVDFCMKIAKKFINIIVDILSKVIKNYKFLALLKRDLFSFIGFIPKMLIVYLSFVLVSKYKMIVIFCYEIMVFQFLRKIIKNDTFIIKLHLISSKEYILSKSVILMIINFVIQFSFSYFYSMRISLLIIQSLMLIVLVIVYELYESLTNYSLMN